MIYYIDINILITVKLEKKTPKLSYKRRTLVFKSYGCVGDRRSDIVGFI